MRTQFCDGITRRDFVTAGAVGMMGLSLGSTLRCEALAKTNTRAGSKTKTAKSAIFIFLGGGPSHLDTFDLKPEAPEEIRGEFKPIDTNVAGLQICEHLPHLARCADRYTVLRGVSHNIAGHGLGTSYVNTGNRPIPSLDFPGLGSVASKELTGSPELPHFVAVPRTPQTPGYLGVRYAPLQTGSVPRAGKPFQVRGLALDGLTVTQFESRQKLLGEVDRAFGELEGASPLVDGLDRFDQQAHAMIRSPKAREAFDVSRENAEVAKPYGRQGFGQSCLLAARLIEAGVRYVTVTFSGWDTHSGNFKRCKESLLPQFDQGMSALLLDLERRGLLESTAVIAIGEFGRTPKINARAGRDHWPRSFTALMAGGGIRAGQVIGASDEKGMGPARDAISPDAIAASFYHCLGIDHRKEYQTNTGRPVMIVREGEVLRQLFG